MNVLNVLSCVLDLVTVNNLDISITMYNLLKHHLTGRVECLEVDHSKGMFCFQLYIFQNPMQCTLMVLCSVRRSFFVLRNLCCCICRQIKASICLLLDLGTPPSLTFATYFDIELLLG